MAYFLPSYFQKRLLRYALTRLDFIDTDALDLDDLDITLGQRSVVELKNVGIRVQQLIERLHLPPTLVLKDALIRQLKVTVPADLHVSGIVVAVNGIDIDVEVREPEAAGAATKPNVARHGAAAHPGSSHSQQRYREDGLQSDDVNHVIPTSQDLAKSFLETEPRKERAELEAVLQSQSQHMTDSVASLHESGLGNPGGFSLPGFVANFFAGVADRLELEISNLEIMVGFPVSSAQAPSDDAKLLLRVGKISLTGANPDASHTQRKRVIELASIEVLLVSEPETFSQHSTSSSPRLSRSRSKVSSTLSSGEFSQFESPHTRFRSGRLEESLLSEGQPSELHLDAQVSKEGYAASSRDQGLALLESQLLPSSVNQEASRLHDLEDSIVDNRQHAEKLMQDGGLKDSIIGSQPNNISEEDLSESKMFTHDEAQSMYMSALSENVGGAGMPGAWASTVDPDPQISKGDEVLGIAQPSPENVQEPSSATPKLTPSTLNEHELPEPPHTQLSSRLVADQPNLLFKRLIEIDQILFKLPASIPTADDEDGDQYGPHVAPISRPDSSQAATTPNHRLRVNSIQEHDKFAGSLLSQSAHFPSNARDFVVNRDFIYEISTGDISCYLDLSICRILIKAASAVKNVLPQSPARDGGDDANGGSQSIAIKVAAIKLNLCDCVPEAGQLKSHSMPQACLLQLSLSEIGHELLRLQDSTRQKLTIAKIELGQSSDRVLYFVDSMNVQNSIATSVMIRPHDLVVLNINDRYDVQLKPLHIVLDLLLVDDILSRGGGLDSLLDLASSAASTGTIRERSVKPQVISRQRTVRFDRPASQPVPEPRTARSGPKIDIRLSGAFVNLMGSESSLQLKTTAIKIVSRSGRAKVQVEHAVVLGPILHGSRTAPEINIKVVNTSIIYVETPAEEDLDRLLSLLTPSNDKYDEEDDIMLDTLIRQRRKGGVIRLSTADVQINVRGVAWHRHIVRIGDELSKLSAVSKYLPEDDRPGVLSFALIEKIGIKVDLGRAFGLMHMNVKLLEGAHVSVPSLMSAQISSVSLRRGENDVILAEVIPDVQESVLMGPPMLMCRFIADEMEPTVRVKLSNTQVEYKVATVVALTELAETLQKDNLPSPMEDSPPQSEISSTHSEMSDFARKVRFSLSIRSSTIGLNPSNLPSKALFLLSDSAVYYSAKQGVSTVQVELRKASILIINDISKLGHESSNVDHRLYFEENDQVQGLTKVGYVPVGSISNASATVKLEKGTSTAPPLVDVECRNNLLLLETCADSTQTLIQILSALSPPSVPSPIANYRTEIVSIQDMLSSFTGNAFVSEPGPELGLQASQVTTTTSTTSIDHSDDESYTHDDDKVISGNEYEVEDDDEDDDDDDDSEDDNDDEEYDDDDSDGAEPYDTHTRSMQSSRGDLLQDSYVDSELSQSAMSGSIHVAPVNVTVDDDSYMSESIVAHSMLDFRTDHFVHKSSVGGTAHRWDSTRNTYELSTEESVKSSPLKVRIRDVHIIWNLFDGYDWQSTRDTISQAVQDIEAKAFARQTRKDNRKSPTFEDEESVIGDFLFNSIYIGIPANKDPKDLTSAINHDVGDLASETGSYATGTTVTAIQAGRIPAPRSSRHKKLRLDRSRHHKMTFELRGVSADVLVFPPGSGEVQSSVDVRVKMLEIFDHVPTSTWKKFATYMSEAGEREVDTSMIHLELLNVKPVADLSASEIVMKLTVLPLRLHVDQDALDFMTRFFEFKDDSFPKPSTPSTPPFLQRVEVNPVRLRLDFKPKRVDYAGLRSGRTTEFMNFFTLERSNMVLRRVILYGVSGFDRLGIMLNDIWSPDVRRNQLPGVLAGLAPIRSLVDVGSGVKDLIAVPIREYKKDGRIVRSVQKGALAFAKTTTTELVNLGAKLAIGTQTVLQSAEELLISSEHPERDEEKEQISLYADQPLGIVQGLRGAYSSLERDLLLAKDAIVAVPGEVMASGSAAGAAKAVLRQSPTIILRPAIGATKAVGQTLLGARNTLNKRNIKNVEDKYKRH